MNIEVIDNNKPLKLKDLNPGDTFYLYDSCRIFYMVLFDENAFENVVCLNNGELYRHDPNERVCKAKKLTIEI